MFAAAEADFEPEFRRSPLEGCQRCTRRRRVKPQPGQGHFKE
jgi:hypothetical protein